MSAEPFEAVIESEDASADGCASLFDSAAEFMREKEGRFELEINIREKE